MKLAIYLVVTSIMIFFSAVSSFVYFFFFSKWAINRRLKRQTPTTSKDLVIDKRMRVVGKVEKHERTLISPISNKECVWCKVVLKTHTSDDVVEYDERRMFDFLLRDRFGQVFIRAKNIDAAISEHVIETTELSPEQKANINQFLLKNGIDNNVFYKIQKFKVHEYCLCVDQKVAVFAHVFQDDQLPDNIKFGLESDLIKAMNISDSVIDDF